MRWSQRRATPARFVGSVTGPATAANAAAAAADPWWHRAAGRDRPGAVRLGYGRACIRRDLDPEFLLRGPDRAGDGGAQNLDAQLVDSGDCGR